MKSPTVATAIFDALDEQHPGADTELHFTNAYELLTATILSAQSTDQRVNMVTPALFARYPSPAALAKATAEELEPQIHSTGFFRAKSKSLIGMATALMAQHGGAVPANMDALVQLPGVGRKTANVVLGHALGAEGEDAEKVEVQLCALLPKARWTRASDCLILHGRRVCKPKPLCPTCLVQEHCDYARTGDATDARGARGAGRKPGLTQLKHKTITTATKNAAPKAAAKTAAKGAPARLVRPGKTSK